MFVQHNSSLTASVNGTALTESFSIEIKFSMYNIIKVTLK